MNYFDTIILLDKIISLILIILFAYKGLWVIIGFFTTKKFPKAKCMHKYAIVIAAKNESKVIGNLIDSINAQDYPKELITTFVVADNCTDNTAEIARKHGAVCYERFDELNKTKGFALKYLFERIEEDYKRNSFEGYFVFDADNLLEKDYVTQMNNSFDSGKKIITSYRMSKNFDANWISASYALHWLRSCRMNHRARSYLNLATNLQGTGFLFSSEIVKEGWKYTSFTEDRAFSAEQTALGYEISYNEKAKFYDEQPDSLKIALRQRLRWAKGHLQAFSENYKKLFVKIFDFKSFAPYDMLCQITPFGLITIFKNLFLFLTSLIFYSANSEIIKKSVFSLIKIEHETTGFFDALMFLLIFSLISFIEMYFVNIVQAVYIFVIERKNIKSFPLYKKIFYAFMWPWFDIIGNISLFIALFVKVEWKPIPHTYDVNIKELEETKK